MQLHAMRVCNLATCRIPKLPTAVLRCCLPLHQLLTMHPCARVLLPLAPQECLLLCCCLQLHVLAMRKSSHFR
jgi:hypothetical protein